MPAALQDIAPSDAARLYLRPLCTLPSPPRPAARIGRAWAGFDAVEVVVREGDTVRRAASTLADARAWARGRGGAIERGLHELIERITMARPPLAGVPCDAPAIMGVLNVTPDSFSDGGDFASTEAALAGARALAEAGAAILDIGGESTRPSSEPVPEAEELGRVIPVIAALAGERSGAAISVDTRKAAVMEAAAAAGAALINDVSALGFDIRARAAVAALGIPVVLMHCQGGPKTMQVAPSYVHAPTDIFDVLAARIADCEAAGIPRERIAVDPGIGFGKSLGHNLAVLADIGLLHGLGCPLVLGVSRKSFIGRLSGEGAPKARLPGSLAAMLWGVSQGVQVVRVHDVAETRQALSVWQAIAAGNS